MTAADRSSSTLGIDDLAELRASVRAALDELAPVSATAALMEGDIPWDRKVWNRLAGELALPGIAIPGEHGGQGFGGTELGIVLEELGRSLYGGPYLSSAAIAAGAITLAADEAFAAAWLPRLAAGTAIATFAVEETWGDWSSSAAQNQLTEAGSTHSGRLSGAVRAVLDGQSADLFLTTALDEEGGVVLVAVEGAQPGVRAEAEPVLDLTRQLSRVTFRDTRAHVVRTRRPARDVVSAVAHLRRAMLANEQVGAARAVLDLTIGHARTRIQFGREIGSFQAVRHRLADLHADVEMAAATARAAAATADWFSPDAAIRAATAASFCSETFLHVSEEAVQLHGGIGFTWEHPAHLYLKRAKSSELVFGDPARHRARLHDQLFAAERQAS